MQIRRLSQKAAAELLGVTSRTLRDWSHAPRNEDGTYPGPELVQWLLDRRMPDEPDLSDQRQRLAAAQAEKVEMDNAVRRGELADMREVERFWTDCIANARAKLLALPTRLVAEMPEKFRAATLCRARELVRETLTELSEYKPPAAQ